MWLLPDCNIFRLAQLTHTLQVYPDQLATGPKMMTEYEQLLADVIKIFASPIPWSCTASANDAEIIAVKETGALLAVNMGEIVVYLANIPASDTQRMDENLLQCLLIDLEALVSNDIPLFEEVSLEFLLTII